MTVVPKMPEKVHFLTRFSFPLVKQLCEKTRTEQFVGGRPGHDKEILFFWLLVKKITNWDYRTIASMAGVSHSTLVRAHDSTLAVPLMRKARPWLKKVAYVLADKGYDDTDIVAWIHKELQAKAGIPLRKKNFLSQFKKNRYGGILNWQMKMKGRTVKKSILHKRVAVERCFSQLKRVFHLGKEAMQGILNFAINAYQSLICLMLKKFYLANIPC